MTQENETIRAIKTLLQEYVANTKSLTDVSLEFKKDILAKLNHRQFTLIIGDIKNLFNLYQTDAYSDVISSFKGLIEAFENSGQTILRSPSSKSIPDVEFYNTGGQKVDNLSLDHLNAGKLIDGRYQLIKQIGFGGMAVVWKALDKIQEEAYTSEDQRYVAIKFIDSNFDQNMFANTVREANRTRSLKHENIISIHTVGKTGGLLFIVMELLLGNSLKQFILEKIKQSRGNPKKDGFVISYEQGMSISRQMAQAIAYAHQSNEHKKGILHLDLKPENIFYNPDNDVIKVLDFGLARYAAKEDDEKTVFKGVDGLTISYASSEMLRRYESDAETTSSQIFEAGVEDDVYSLACIIYELFSGKKPFGSLNSLQAEEANKQLVPLKFKKKQWQALAKALAFKRKKRTANVDVFINEFISDVSEKKPLISTRFSKVFVTLFLVAILFFLVKNNLIPGSASVLKQLGFFSLMEEDINQNNQSSGDTAPVLKIEATPDSKPNIQRILPAILKYWTVVNGKNRNVIEINENTEKAIEHFKIGDNLKISFLANEKVNLNLVYIDSLLNVIIKPLTNCCEANKTYNFPEENPMTILEPIGTDKIRILLSKNKIDEEWIRLNDEGEIDEQYIRNKLTNYPAKEERFFINGKLDLIISN